MAKVKLFVSPGYLREIDEQDSQGQIIYPENAKNILFCISNKLVVDSGSLCFQISLKIPKDKLSTTMDAKQACLSWCKTYFPNDFSKRDYWNFFSIQSLVFTSTTVQEEINEYNQMEFEVSISDKMNETINNAIEHINSVQLDFENAKNKLTDLAFNNSAFGFNQSLGEAKEQFRVIEKVLRCSADLGGYTPSNVRSALNCYEELAKRKVENNSIYQIYLRDLQKFVFGISFPSCWGQKPNAQQARTGLLLLGVHKAHLDKML